MTRELTTELVVVSLVPPMGPRTSTSTFGCNKHDCFTPHRLLSIPSSVFLGPSHLPSHWFLLPFLLFLTLSFGCDFLSLPHPSLQSVQGSVPNDRHRRPPRPRATHAMGGLASRLRGAAWSSDPYYASYERALERIEGETNALEVGRNTRRRKT